MNHDLVSNIERGRRGRVSVEELAVLAAALNVSPAALVDPGENEVDLTDSVSVGSRVFRAWLTSRAPLRGQDPREFEAAAVSLLGDLPEVDEAVRERALAAQTLKQRLFEPLPDEPQLEQESRERDELFRGLHEEGARIRDAKKGDA